jgi:hypothetical protein
MLTIEDCIALCELSPEEVRAIAAHEQIPEIAAAELGSYLVQCTGGELRIKAMIREDIAHAITTGDRMRELALKMMLREFVLRHPKCEERHRQALGVPERRETTMTGVQR